MSFIYRILNIKNNKKYIGKTSRKLQYRKSQHFSELRRNTHHNSYLQRSFNKYGEENFKLEILVEGKFTNEELNKLEKIYILLYGTTNEKYGYNLAAGGEGLNDPTGEIKKKISNTVKEYFKTEAGLRQLQACHTEEANKKRVEGLLKAHAKKNFIERKRHKDWDLAQDIYLWWADSNNASGSKTHPGHTTLTQAFNITRGFAKVLITEFSNGWVPVKDPEWNKYFKAKGINPKKPVVKSSKKGKVYYSNRSREWAKAFKGYNYWQKNNCTIMQLKAHLDTTERIAIDMQKRFRSGWNPNNDKEFIREFLNE